MARDQLRHKATGICIDFNEDRHAAMLGDTDWEFVKAAEPVAAPAPAPTTKKSKAAANASDG
jgi:hypothetical protein